MASYTAEQGVNEDAVKGGDLIILTRLQAVQGVNEDADKGDEEHK